MVDAGLVLQADSLSLREFAYISERHKASRQRDGVSTLDWCLLPLLNDFFISPLSTPANPCCDQTVPSSLAVRSVIAESLVWVTAAHSDEHIGTSSSLLSEQPPECLFSTTKCLWTFYV